MLTPTDQRVSQPTVTTDNSAAARDPAPGGRVAKKRRGRLAKALSVEWLGQTVASLCWITSVFVYGISSAGDWLQLGAASAWLVANLAAVAACEAD